MIEWTDEEMRYLHQLVNPPTTKLFALNRVIWSPQNRANQVKYRLSQLLKIKICQSEKRKRTPTTPGRITS